MMAGDFFLWVLAGATVAAGIALLVVLFRRPQPLMAKPKRSGSHAEQARSQPDDLMGDDEPDDGHELAKICPTCGLRYRHEFRTCQRDNSELAAIN